MLPSPLHDVKTVDPKHVNEVALESNCGWRLRLMFGNTAQRLWHFQTGFGVCIFCLSVWSSTECHLCDGIVKGSTPPFQSPTQKDSISTYICLFSTLQPCPGS
jgi:hypothetical protein